MRDSELGFFLKETSSLNTWKEFQNFLTIFDCIQIRFLSIKLSKSILLQGIAIYIVKELNQRQNAHINVRYLEIQKAIITTNT